MSMYDLNEERQADRRYLSKISSDSPVPMGELKRIALESFGIGYWDLTADQQTTCAIQYFGE